MEILETIKNEYKVDKNSLNYLNFTDISHYGIPKNIAPVIAYHNIQGIIGLGTIDGKIKL